MGKKIWLSTCFMLTLIIFMTSPERSTAMSNPDGTNINWGTDDANTFIRSVTTNTLGREPNQYDLQKFEQVNWKKFPFFISVIASQEYQNQFSWLSKVYHVYFTPKWNQDFTSLCNCYYIADNNQNAGLMPAMQYTGVYIPPSPRSFPVARALVEMCWTYDRNACDSYDCGKANPEASRLTPVVPGPAPVGGVPGPTPVPSSPREELNRHCNHITSQLQAARERGDIYSYRNLLEGYRQCDFYDEAIMLLEQFPHPIAPSSTPVVPGPTPVGVVPREELNRHCNHITSQLQAARERGDINSYRNLLGGYRQCDFYDEAIMLLEQFPHPIPSPTPAPADDPEIQCEGHTIHCKAEGYPNSIGKTYSNYSLDQNKDKFCDLCDKPFTGSAVTHPGMICIERKEQ